MNFKTLTDWMKDLTSVYIYISNSTKPLITYVVDQMHAS